MGICGGGPKGYPLAGFIAGLPICWGLAYGLGSV